MSDTAFQCLDCKQWREESERNLTYLQCCVYCEPGLRKTPRRASDNAASEDEGD